MARNSLRSRIPLLVPLALVLSGCPSSCQQRRTVTRDSGEKIAIQVGKTEIERQKGTTARKGARTIKKFRPDGTPWEVVEEKDDSTTVLELDRELMEKAAGASIRWQNDADVTASRPWWHFPALVILAGVIGAGLAIAIRWRFWTRG